MIKILPTHIWLELALGSGASTELLALQALCAQGKLVAYTPVRTTAGTIYRFARTAGAKRCTMRSDDLA